MQRSIEDQSILVATYEGEHNHDLPSKLEQPATASTTVSRCLPPAVSGGSAAAASLNTQAVLDVPAPKTAPAVANVANAAKTSTPAAGSSSLPVDRPDFQQFFIEQMASSLTKDPTFKAAIAAAISGKFLPHNNIGKW